MVRGCHDYGLWRPFYDTSFSCKDKASVNGVLYFIMSYKACSLFHPRNRIAAFDLGSEEWKPETIQCRPLEHSKEEDAWDIGLTELKGTLCVVQNIRHLGSLGGHYVNIWLLMDPNKSIWVKKYRIHMPGRFLLSTKALDVCRCFSTDSLPRGYLGQYVRASAYAELDG